MKDLVTTTSDASDYSFFFSPMLPEALRYIREFHDLTQADLAEKLGVSRSFLSEIESDKKPASLELLEKYSKVFSIPKSSLFLFAESLAERPLKATPRAKLADKVLRIMRWIAAKEEK